MGAGKLADDRQPEPAALAGSGRIAPVESLERAGRAAGRESRPIVDDGEGDCRPVDLGASVHCPSLEADLPARADDREGVVDEVAEDPVERDPVGRE